MHKLHNRKNEESIRSPEVRMETKVLVNLSECIVTAACTFTRPSNTINTFDLGNNQSGFFGYKLLIAIGEVHVKLDKWFSLRKVLLGVMFQRAVLYNISLLAIQLSIFHNN